MSFLTIYRAMRACGIDPIKCYHMLPQLFRTVGQWEAFPGSGFYPALGDDGEAAGYATGQYFHQDLWAARRIYKARPSSHVDVGSQIGGFISHLLVFMPVTVVDIRRLETDEPNLTFIQDDATAMRMFEDNSVGSLSSLHAVEHFGLGRYGDAINPVAHLSAMTHLARVLAPGGRLYFSVPIGKERVEFNSYRIISPDTILSAFAGLKLVTFCAVDEAGAFQANRNPSDFANSENACGLFEFTK